MTFRWQIRPEDAWPRFTQTQVDALENDLVAFVEGMLDEVASDMKTQAPWTDRTGNARASLFTALIHEARRTVGILLSHGSVIDYSTFLEYGFSGRFAILAPSVDRWGPKLLAGAQKILRERFR